MSSQYDRFCSHETPEWLAEQKVKKELGEFRASVTPDEVELLKVYRELYKPNKELLIMLMKGSK